MLKFPCPMRWAILVLAWLGGAVCETFAVIQDGAVWADEVSVVQDAMNWTAVSCGGRHTCALTDHTPPLLYCWGRNTYNQTDVPARNGWLSVSSGFSHTCAVAADRTAVCWGRNDARQASAPSGAFVDISAGYAHTCGVRANGSVVCWGDNSFGQCAAPGGPFSSVCAGKSHSCGVRANKTLACWGLGDGRSAAFDDRARPPFGANFRQVSCMVRGVTWFLMRAGVALVRAQRRRRRRVLGVLRQLPHRAAVQQLLAGVGGAAPHVRACGGGGGWKRR
jgi:hypothetical protein